MNKLWLGFAAIAAYGSIYPFDFQFHQLDPAAWQAFIDTCCVETSRGDILGNVVLFLPFGYLGILAAAPETRPIRQFLFVCVVGVVFAFLLQVAQLYLPSRDENLQDVIWNLLGIAVGAGLGIPSRQFILKAAGQGAQLHLVPWILIGSWVTYRLIPFVPSIDFQSIKDSIKPLLDLQELSLAGIAYHAVAWLIVGYLMDLGLQGKRLGRLLPLAVLGTFAAEIIIVYNIVTPTTIAGGLIAIVLYWAVISRINRVELPLLIGLLATIAWNDLQPFIIRAEPIDFNWLPFQGFLGGSMFVNAQSASEKVFAYGSIVYLLMRLGAASWISLLAATAWIAGIEFAQTYVIRHTPEITDPLLVILAAIAIFAVEGMDEKPARSQGGRLRQGPSSGRRSETRKAGLAPPPSQPESDPTTRPEWVVRRVNLNATQAQLLESLAREMGVSISEASRKIINDTLTEVGQYAQDPFEQRKKLTALTLRGAAGLITRENETARWVAWDIALHPAQFDFIQQVSNESGSSVSRVIRRIIDRFFSQLSASVN